MITFTEAQLTAWLSPLIWPFIRVLAVFSALPIFNRRNVPLRVRIALAAFITATAQPSLPEMPVVPLDSMVAVMLVVQQVLIGVTIGFAVRAVFAAVEYAGELIGLQMGLNFAASFDPVSAGQSTATASFFATMVAWLFIALNGHLIVISAVVNSFQTFPVSPEPFGFLRKAMPHRWGAEIFATGLWIALPVITMLLFVNLVLGFISRVATQMQIFSIGFPITLGLGLAGLYYIVPALEQPFMMTLDKVLSALR
ncbi:MAG: flagellar biosynthetic protein FliR [Betaproteobacteria bacterium]